MTQETTKYGGFLKWAHYSKSSQLLNIMKNHVFTFFLTHGDVGIPD